MGMGAPRTNKRRKVVWPPPPMHYASKVGPINVLTSEQDAHAYAQFWPTGLACTESFKNAIRRDYQTDRLAYWKKLSHWIMQKNDEERENVKTRQKVREQKEVFQTHILAVASYFSEGYEVTWSLSALSFPFHDSISVIGHHITFQQSCYFPYGRGKQ